MHTVSLIERRLQAATRARLFDTMELKKKSGSMKINENQIKPTQVPSGFHEFRVGFKVGFRCSII